MKRWTCVRLACLSVLLVLVALVAACSSGSPEDIGSIGERTVYATGVDYSFARPSPSGLKKDGFTFACRYLSPPPNSKNLSKAEADALWAAGVDVVANFEEAATNALGGHAQGVTDAKVADGEANADGIPKWRPIYFSVDFDATTADFAAIDAYFDGVASVIGEGRTGAYGGYAVIKHLFDVGKIRWGWQTYAWSGGAWDSRAQLRQVLNDITAAGDTACCDKDEAMAKDYGQWHASPIDPCASAADGKYCGQSTQWEGGTKDHLYDCVGGVTKSDVDCPGGCVIEPSGHPDVCAAYDAGPDVSTDAHDGEAGGDGGDAKSDAGDIDAHGDGANVDGGEGSDGGGNGLDDNKGGCSIARVSGSGASTEHGSGRDAAGWAIFALFAATVLVRRGKMS
jgi:hypothetical protein